MFRPTIMFFVGFTLAAAAGADAQDVADAILATRSAARVAADAVEGMKLNSLPISYTHGKSLELEIMETRKTIKNIDTYATRAEHAASVVDLYFLNTFVEGLRRHLADLSRSVRASDVKTEAQNRLVSSISTSLMQAETTVVEASGDLFEATLASFREVDDRLEMCRQK